MSVFEVDPGYALIVAGISLLFHLAAWLVVSEGKRRKAEQRATLAEAIVSERDHWNDAAPLAATPHAFVDPANAETVQFEVITFREPVPSDFEAWSRGRLSS